MCVNTKIPIKGGDKNEHKNEKKKQQSRQWWQKREWRREERCIMNNSFLLKGACLKRVGLFLFFLIFFIPLKTYHGIDHIVNIKEIITTGDTITKQEVIEYFCSFHQEEGLSIEKLNKKIEESENRLQDLGWFDYVNICYIPLDETNVRIVIDLKDGYPYVFFPQGNAFFVVKNNVDGRGVSVGGGIGLDNINAVYFSPFIFKLPLSVDLFLSRFYNDLTIYEGNKAISSTPFTRSSFSFILSKKFSYLTMGAGEQIDFIEIDAPDDGKIFSTKVFWDFDKRDSSRKPTRGWKIYLDEKIGENIDYREKYSEFFGLAEQHTNFNTIINSIRFEYGNSNNLPDLYLFDLRNSVRSSYYNSISDEKLLAFSEELRATLKDWLELVVFFDKGFVGEKKESIKLNKFTSGYGLGTRIYVPPPVNVIASLMFASNPQEGGIKTFFNIRLSF